MIFHPARGQFYTNDPVKASRKDFNLSLGSAVSWTPIENVSFGVTESYVGSFSSVGARRYDVFVPSIVATGSPSNFVGGQTGRAIDSSGITLKFAD